MSAEGIKIIPRTISQNPVENLFSLLRSFCGSISNPSFQQTVTALSSVIQMKETSINTKSSSYCVDRKGISYSDSDVSALEKRHQKLKNREPASKRRRFPLFITDNLAFEDIQVPANRISLAIQRKKKFQLNDSSSVLNDMILFATRAANTRNLSKNLPGDITDALLRNYGDSFIEDIIDKPLGCDPKKLLAKTATFISTVTISEFLLNNGLCTIRGAKSLRRTVPDSLDISHLPEIVARKGTEAQIDTMDTE